MTSSFGAVQLPDRRVKPLSVLREADQRLYAQKRRKASRDNRVDRPLEVLLQALYEREPNLHTQIHDVASRRRGGSRLGLDRGEVEELSRAAMLHDVGKLAIPDQILHKPDALDAPSGIRAPAHRRRRADPRRVAGAPPVGKIVRSSHERWDGAGYPDGFAARRSSRCEDRVRLRCLRGDDDGPDLPGAMSMDEAVAELERCSGSQFDPEVVAVLTAVLRAWEASQGESRLAQPAG